MRPQTRRAALGPLAGISGNRPRTARLRGPAMPKSHAWNPDPRPCSTQAGPCATDAAPADYPKRALNFLYADQMLTHSLQHHRDAGAALSQYFNIALQQYAAAQQVMRACFSAADPTLTVLDFACGYGRLLRFLSLTVPRTHLWASELQPDAVAFVAQEFDVQVLASHADPIRFKPMERFDFIWVASLFSHLPEELFYAWLEKLVSLLTPRGVLCFSVRDSALVPPSRVLPESGILYDRFSENAELDAEIYGTTYASESFVRAAVRRALSVDAVCVRLPKALAHEQDLYVVARDSTRDLSAVSNFRRGPWGWVDRRQLTAAGELELEGWAASLDDGQIDDVEVVIDGVRHRCNTGRPRGDVRDAFGDERLTVSGWRFMCDLGPSVREAFVEVGAYTARGESTLLFAGIIRNSPADAAVLESSTI